MAVKTFSAQYWAAKYFRPVWFAEADDGHLTDGERSRHRTKPNIKFVPIKSAKVTLKGVSARAELGGIQGFGIHVRPTVHVPTVTAIARVRSSNISSATGRIRGTGGAGVRVSGSTVRVGSGKLSVRGGAINRMNGQQCSVAFSSLSYTCGATVAPCDSEELYASVGRISGRGIHNPSDEELALLALRLTTR